jgi:hypothetical protein
MSVCVGQRRLVRSSVDAKVNQLPQTAGNAVTDLSQRIGSSEMAKQHRHQLVPARKSLRPPLCAMFADQLFKLDSWYLAEELTE